PVRGPAALELAPALGRFSRSVGEMEAQTAAVDRGEEVVAEAGLGCGAELDGVDPARPQGLAEEGCDRLAHASGIYRHPGHAPGVLEEGHDGALERHQAGPGPAVLADDLDHRLVAGALESDAADRQRGGVVPSGRRFWGNPPDRQFWGKPPDPQFWEERSRGAFAGKVEAGDIV